MHPRDPELLAAPAPRGLQIAIGLLAAVVTAFIALIFFVNSREWLLQPSARELSPVAATLVASGTTAFIWFLGSAAYRLILNRPKRRGGLFSSAFLHVVAVIVFVASVVVFAAPGNRLQVRVRALLYGCPMAVACWLVARRRAASERVNP